MGSLLGTLSVVRGYLLWNKGVTGGIDPAGEGEVFKIIPLNEGNPLLKPEWLKNLNCVMCSR